MNMPLPVVLTSAVSVTSGQTATFDSRALSHPYRKPMFITDIDFQLRVNDTSETGTIPTITKIGGMIWVKMRLGRHNLMNAFVPVWNLGPYISDEARSDHSSVGVVTAAAQYVYNFYRWRLPRPMFVPQDGSLSILAYRSPQLDGEQGAIAGSTAVQVYATVTGRTVDAKQDTSDIPYVAAYVAKNGDVGSNETELKNELSQSVNVSFISARVQSATGGNGSGPGDLLSTIAGGVEATNNMTMYYGRDFIVRDPTPWKRVFSYARCGISTDSKLAAGDRYLVRLFNAVAATYRPMVAVVGWRQEGI